MSHEQDALRAYVANSRESLKKLLHRLNWTEQGVRKLHRPPQAPIVDKAHIVQLPCSCQDAPKHSVQLNATVLQQLLGPAITPIQLINNTFEDLQANFSATQKLLIYDHVLQQTPRQRLSFEENANFAQLVADTKKAHKKQRRHRKSKPTLHEEMHQLVELQMQALQQQHMQKQQQNRPLLLNVAKEGRKQPSQNYKQLEPHYRRRRSPSRNRDRRRNSPYTGHSRRHKEHSRSRSRSRHKTKQRHLKPERSRSPQRRSNHRSHKRSRYS